MKIKRTHLVGGALIALSLLVLPGIGDEIRFPKQLGMFFFASILLAKVFWEKISPEVGFFYGIISISAISSGFGYPFQMHDLYCVTAALLISCLVSDLTVNEMKPILLCVLWAALINASYGYVQMMGRDFIFLYKTPGAMLTPTGFLGQQTLLGPLLAAGFAVSLFYGQYYFSLFFLPVIFATGASFTYASIGAAVYLYGVWRLGFKRMLAIPVVAMSFLFYLNAVGSQLMNPQSRFDIWGRIVNSVVSEHPFFGYGFGTYLYHAGKYQTQHEVNMNGIFQQAHSDPVQLFHDTGVIGLTAAGLMLFTFFRQLAAYFRFREVAAAGTVAVVILVNSVGNFPLRLVPQGLIFCLAGCMVISFRRKEAFA